MAPRNPPSTARCPLVRPRPTRVRRQRAVLEALKEQVKQAGVKEAGNVEVVLIGHDRGARVAHHLTVSGVSGIKILGVCLIDIVRSLSVSPCNLEHRKLKRHRSPPQHNGSTLSLLLLRQRK